MTRLAIQRLLLLLFAAFAALTVLQQIRYGMICGRSEQEDKQDDPEGEGVPPAELRSTPIAQPRSALMVNIVIGATEQVKAERLAYPDRLFCFEKCAE